SRRPRLQGRAVARARRIAGGVRTAVEDSIRPALDTPAGRTAVGLAELCRPLWWVVRGWLWFVLVVRVLGVLRWGGVPPEVSVRDFVPASPLGWLVAGAAMLASLEVGRRRLARGTWSRRAALALSVAAVVSLPWAVSTVWGRVDGAGEAVQYVPYEVEVPVPAEPEDGVYVGGMLVSNLFVYD
ncbi:hypothetical protein N867_18310, partial [Actinotalea fermentans ATCC 43279 = JCM 9966 = DSM 3133]